MAVQFCGTCGHPLIPEQLFCQHCGSRADENATRGVPSATPGIPVSSAGTLYCGQCGALVGSQDRVCRRCGAPVEPSQGGGSDPSLSDLPTMMGGTPVPPVYQAPPYQAPPTPMLPQTPIPDYQAQQPPPGWGASYNPAPSYNDSPTFTVGAPGPAVQAPPYRPAPAGPGGPPQRRGPRWPLVIAVVLVALALIAGGGVFLLLHLPGGNQQGNGQTPGVTQTPGITVTPSPIPSPTPVTLTPEGAEGVINEFYQDINNKNYDAAYDLLSQEYRSTHPHQAFVDGYKTTVSSIVNILNAQELTDGSNAIRVNITLVATDNKNGSNVTTNYAGYYDVVLENGKLLILRAKVNKQ